MGLPNSRITSLGLGIPTLTFSVWVYHILGHLVVYLPHLQCMGLPHSRITCCLVAPCVQIVAVR